MNSKSCGSNPEGLAQCWPQKWPNNSQSSADNSQPDPEQAVSYVFTPSGEMKCCIKSYQNDLLKVCIQYVYRDSSKLTACLSLKSFYVMKHNHMLTDVKLEVVPEIFHAHKVILAAASPYFKGNVIDKFLYS